MKQNRLRIELFSAQFEMNRSRNFEKNKVVYMSFIEHLTKIDAAWHSFRSVEDGYEDAGQEVDAMNACFDSASRLEVAIRLANQAKEDLENEIKRSLELFNY